MILLFFYFSSIVFTYWLYKIVKLVNFFKIDFDQYFVLSLFLFDIKRSKKTYLF